MPPLLASSTAERRAGPRAVAPYVERSETTSFKDLKEVVTGEQKLLILETYLASS